MAKSWFAGVVENYCDVMQRGQRRLLEAQQEACLTWISLLAPMPAFKDSEVARRVDGGLLMGANLVQAQADTQRDFMLLTEKLLADANRQMQAQLTSSNPHPSMGAVCQALEVGCLSGAALSKVSRQVGHFAATSLSSTPLRAACDARRVWRQQKP